MLTLMQDMFLSLCLLSAAFTKQKTKKFELKKAKHEMSYVTFLDIAKAFGLPRISSKIL